MSEKDDALVAEVSPLDPADLSTGAGELGLEEMKTELAKVRREAASRRVANKETEAKLAEYDKWKLSQMSELEKAQAERAQFEKDAESAAREAAQLKAAAKAGLSLDLADRVRGDSFEDMIEDAKKLAARAPASGSTGDLFGGSRGKAVGTKGPKSGGAAFNDMVRGH